MRTALIFGLCAALAIPSRHLKLFGQTINGRLPRNAKLPARGETGFASPRAIWHDPYRMSAQEIIAELPKLSRSELEQADAELDQLLRRNEKSSSLGWGQALRAVAGAAQGLPADLAHSHDHYLHGTPLR